MRILAAATAFCIGTCVQASNSGERVIKRDVAIIGGGGSGAYSAVRLREDYGASVVVIEKEGILGGHVNTWVDPTTGRGFDAGVQSYIELPGALPFFQRFNITTQANIRNNNAQLFVDFTSGVSLTNYVTPSASDRTDALTRYLALAEQYQPLMEPGWWNFPQPDNIPADLLLPYGEFVEKYNLSAGLPQIFATTGFGKNDILDSLTMFIFRSFNVDMTRTLLGINNGFVPSSRKNQELYDAIQRTLGPDILPFSTVIRTPQRCATDGVVLKVKNSLTGEYTRVKAKRLLYTITTTEENHAAFDFDNEEKSAFGHFQYSISYVGIVSHPSLPLNTTLVNMPIAAQPANYLASIPAAPFNTRFDNYADSPYFRVIVAGDTSLTERQARKVVFDSFNKLVTGRVIKQSEPAEELRFHLFTSHGKVSPSADRQSLEAGLVQKLNALQGRRSTWYTGGAWSVHISTSLWVYTETVLERLVQGLK